MAESGPSFESLVASVTRDLRPRAVLDEWLDRGLVTLDPQERIVLSEAAFVPSGGGSQQLYYFGRNLHDHIAAAVTNILEEMPRFFERAVHYDGLSPELARRARGAGAGDRQWRRCSRPTARRTRPARPIRAARRAGTRHLHLLP